MHTMAVMQWWGKAASKSVRTGLGAAAAAGYCGTALQPLPTVHCCRYTVHCG